MKTKYSIGDSVLVKAKVERIEIDEGETTYFLSGFWDGFEMVAENDIFPSKSAPKSSRKPKKASEKPEKAEKNGKNRQKTAKGTSKAEKGTSEAEKGTPRVKKGTSEGQQDKKVTSRQQGAKDPEGQQENKAKASPRQQDTSHVKNFEISLSPLGKSLAKELAKNAR